MSSAEEQRQSVGWRHSIPKNPPKPLDNFSPPQPGWRRVSPHDAFGTPISFDYAMELAELVRGHDGELPDGASVRVDYRCVAGEWFPIPESLLVLGG